MEQTDLYLKRDRMRYTKDSLSSNLVLLAIVLDALYFISIYKTDVGTYYYSWVIGASVIFNLLFLLTAFLASQGVKNRKPEYCKLLMVLGVLQVIRVFYLPAKAHNAEVVVGDTTYMAMGDGQYYFVIACLIVSAVSCIAASVICYINCKNLAQHMRELEEKAA